jgi:oligosaccharide repeat unit polymerase
VARLLASRETVPAIGFLAAAIATVIAAIVLFPDRPSPPGALLLPAIVLTFGILFIPLVRLMSGSADLTNAENFVCLGYVFWLLLDLLQGVYDLRDASDWALRMALVAIGLSAACMWIGMAGREWRVPAWLTDVAKRPLETQTIMRLVVACFLLGMLNFVYAVDFDIPLMFSYLGGNRWAAPWTRGQLGGWSSFIDQMPYFGYVLPSLTALLIARRGLWRASSLFAVACSIIMLLFLSQGGGRRIIGITVGAALLVWVQSHPGIRLKNIIVVGVGTIAMAWASQFLLNIRSVGLETFLEQGSEVDYLHIDDNFLRLAQVIDLVPEDHPHVGWRQLTFTLVRPVPRVFWPDKPVDPGFDLTSAVGMKGLTITMSIIGEWYLSFGWLAIAFGGWFHGRLAKAADGLRVHGQTSQNPIVYALVVMVLVAGMRSMVDLVVMSYALVAWWGANRLMSRRADV